MPDAAEALAMDALFFQRSDQALDQAVLLEAMRRDELLFQTVASNQRSVAPRCEDQPVVGPQQKLLPHLAERAEPVDQGMLQGAGYRARLAGP